MKIKQSMAIPGGGHSSIARSRRLSLCSFGSLARLNFASLTRLVDKNQNTFFPLVRTLQLFFVFLYFCSKSRDFIVRHTSTRFRFTMGFCEIVGLFVILYYLFYAIFPWFLDSDVELAFYEKWGRPLESLRGKVVWITGVSSGIGEHLAYTLAKVGCKLVLTARRENLLNQVKEKCLRINANLKETDVLVLPMDVANIDLHKDAFDLVISTFGQLDILVNNAGRTQRAIWENVEPEVDKHVFQLNVFSAVALSRLAVKHFMENGQGHLVVTSSIAGIRGVPFSGSYTGSKHALHGYFECLRNEKLNKKLPITMICPGPIQTPFLFEGFTEKAGVKFGHETEISKMKMAPGRCAKLMAVAIANEVPEAWIGNALVIQLTYLTVHYPNISRLVYNFLGPRALQKLRDSKVTK